MAEVEEGPAAIAVVGLVEGGVLMGGRGGGHVGEAVGGVAVEDDEGYMGGARKAGLGFVVAQVGDGAVFGGEAGDAAGGVGGGAVWSSQSEV